MAFTAALCLIMTQFESLVSPQEWKILTFQVHDNGRFQWTMLNNSVKYDLLAIPVQSQWNCVSFERHKRGQKLFLWGAAQKSGYNITTFPSQQWEILNLHLLGLQLAAVDSVAIEALSTAQWAPWWRPSCGFPLTVICCDVTTGRPAWSRNLKRCKCLSQGCDGNPAHRDKLPVKCKTLHLWLARSFLWSINVWFA